VSNQLWYLASPYSHPDQAVMVSRFEQVNEFASRLMRAGVMIFSPISHTHPIAQYGLPKGWDYWERYDRCILAKCCGVIVCQFDGWRESTGVQAEIKIAREMGLAVFYVCPDAEEAADFIQRRAWEAKLA
jgi:hypothetical protein